MRTRSSITILLCLLATQAGNRLSAQSQVQDNMTVWLNPQANQKSRVDAFLAVVTAGEAWSDLIKRYASNPKDVSDALILAFEQSERAGGQPHALYYMMVVGDRASYSQIVERALSSSVKEVRGNAFAAAAVFQDRSKLMVSALLTEIRNTNSPDNLSMACRVSAKLQLQEAIEPMTDVVANASLGRAREVAEALSQYPSLPEPIQRRLEAARTRFEREQTESNKRPKSPLQLTFTNSGPTEFELLFTALDKVKEKALLPPPPGMEQPKAPYVRKKTATSGADGKTPKANASAPKQESPSSASNPGGTGRNNFLLLLGLAPLAAIAWFLLKGRLR